MNDEQLTQLINGVSTRLDKLNSDILTVLKPGQFILPVNPGLQPGTGEASIFQIPLDLTAAINNQELKAPLPFNWIQVWSDGVLDGISITLTGRGTETFDLSQTPIIPVTSNPDKIYFTSDLRQGRNKAIVYCIRGPSPLNVNFGGQDISLSELAARLNSINTFDRRGEIIFQDDFEASFGKWTIPFGTALLSTDKSRSGAVSAKIVTGVNLNDISQIQVNIPIIAKSKIGIEAPIVFSISAYHDISIKINSSSNPVKGILRLNTKDSKLQYIDSAGNFQDIAGITFSTAYPINTFHALKLVIDPLKLKYVRAIYDNLTYDLSQIDLLSELVPAGGQFTIVATVAVNNRSVAATAATAYVDDVLITRNEP